MSRYRAELMCWLVVGLALMVVLLGLDRSPALGLSLAALVGLVGMGVIARLPVATMGALCVVGFAFTASWDSVTLGGLKPRVVFLAAGFVLLLLGTATKRLPSIPWWVHCFGGVAVMVTIIQTIFPLPDSYMNARYIGSVAGTRLGSRPDVIPSLAYLLLNVYVVPIVVAMSVVAVRKSLRWIINAYVLGVALSCLAGYLGFIGMPWLINLFGATDPGDFRAMGFTIHSLHLATSGVMAAALGCWMAVQRQPLEKWAGRASILAILLGMYASGSRGGNAATLISLALAVFLIPQVRRRGHIVVGGVVSVLGVVVLLVPAFGQAVLRTTRLVNGATSDVSDVGRGQVFQQGINDFAHSPIFGIGTRFIAEAHVLYVGVAASGGALLLLGYLLFNLGSIRATSELMRTDRALGGALMATFLGSLAYWSVGDEFPVASVQIAYAILIAASCAAAAAKPAGTMTSALGRSPGLPSEGRAAELSASRSPDVAAPLRG